jgi:uncharacterized membrane protein (Fun14 family)
MSKLTIGLLVGAILGFVDGMSAMLSPEVHNILVFIVIASTIKGFVTGLLAGFVARRTNNFVLAIVTGLAVGLVLSFSAAVSTPDSAGRHYYWEIMLPGAVLGMLAGYSSQRFGRKAAA